MHATTKTNPENTMPGESKISHKRSHVYDSTFIKCSELLSSKRQSRLVISRDLGDGRMGVIANGYRASFGMMKILLNYIVHNSE